MVAIKCNRFHKINKTIHEKQKVKTARAGEGGICNGYGLWQMCKRDL